MRQRLVRGRGRGGRPAGGSAAPEMRQRQLAQCPKTRGENRREAGAHNTGSTFSELSGGIAVCVCAHRLPHFPSSAERPGRPASRDDGKRKVRTPWPWT